MIATQEPSPLTEEQILTIAENILKARFTRSNYLTSPDHTRAYLRVLFSKESREVFGMVMLDNQHGVLGHEKLFYGTIDSAFIYPREIVKTVLNTNTSAVILVHNHPSGCAEPSIADKAITQKISEALKTIDVRVLDHLLVAGTQIVSFAELGLIT